MELLNVAISAYIIAFSGAMMPGPLLTGTVSKTVEIGIKAGPLLIVGHALLEFLLIVILIAGLGHFLQNDIFITAISFAGAIVLFYMAWGMFRSLPSLTLTLSPDTKKVGNTVVAGALLSLSNPYWFIWWVTIGAGYIIFTQKYGLLGTLLFFIGHILGDFTWYAFISFLVHSGKKYFTDKIYKYLIGFCASFLMLFSVIFMIYGIKTIGT